MRGFGGWLLVFSSCALLGAGLGTAADELLARLSWDFTLLGDDYLDYGRRWGGVAGGLFAFLRISGRAPDLELRRLSRVLVVSALVSIVVLLAASALRYGWLVEAELSSWRLPNPRRHALFIVADEAVRTSPFLWMLLGSAGILVARWRGPACYESQTAPDPEA